MILIKLILAHLIGDFFAQTSKDVNQKKESGWRSPKLYIHAIIHFMLVWIFLWDFNAWLIALIIGSSHLIIDGIKTSVKEQNVSAKLFFVDQTAHIIVIFIVWVLFFDPIINISISFETWIILCGLILITNPAAYAIGILLKSWFKEDDAKKMDYNYKKSVSFRIGIFERIFIYVSILIQSPEIIGFLIAAKSVFRFSEKVNENNESKGEYYFLGTMISYLFAIIVAILVRNSI